MKASYRGRRGVPGPALWSWCQEARSRTVLEELEKENYTCCDSMASGESEGCGWRREQWAPCRRGIEIHFTMVVDRVSWFTTGGYTQNGTFSEFCILSRHLDRFCSSKRPRGPRGPPELPNDKKTAAPRLLDRLLFRYPPPQIRLKWDVLSVTFNGKFQR